MEKFLKMAEEHGRDEGYEMWVGDLEELLREAWQLFTPAQKKTFRAGEAVRNLKESVGK